MQAKEIAETANTAKSDFLSRMSHELRTPLNAILGFAQLLEYDINHPLDTEQKESVSEILTAGNHLLELINDILDLSKIETGALGLDIKPISLSSIISDAYSLIKNFARQKNVNLLFPEPDEMDFTVHADNVRLKQTLLNLLNNAVKYNTYGGTVTLDLQIIDNATVKISITDTGIGIAPEFQERVFTPFDRLGADARAIDGTGIGLVISKQLIELMNGKIGFYSEADAGTTFWFTLPLTSESEIDSQTDSDCNILAAEVSKNPKKLILCIEDNEANKRLIENIITSKTPHEILTVTTAEEGIELLQTITPDVILMDITLPGMNGIEATRIIRHRTDYKHTPIIAISANAMVDDIKQGLNSGFTDYLTKPIDITIFMATLLNYLN